jgi:non-heme chloroperoxidase
VPSVSPEPDVDIHYEDHGTGRPVLLMHGFPLDGTSWERQTTALLAAGYRVITPDRRGFGRSSRPVTGYDYDTFAADLHAVIEHLDLRDAVLVGFSMGTGDVTRYLARYGSDRVAKAVLIATIPPFVLKTDDNPDGVDGAAFAEIAATIEADRYAYLTGYFRDFYRTDLHGSTRVSPEVIAANVQVAAAASAVATRACVDTWLTDFRPDLPTIDVPVLLIHGTADVNLPIGSTGDRLPSFLDDLTVIRVEGGPHNVPWTHPEIVNPALLEFVAS